MLSLSGTLTNTQMKVRREPQLVGHRTTHDGRTDEVDFPWYPQLTRIRAWARRLVFRLPCPVISVQHHPAPSTRLSFPSPFSEDFLAMFGDTFHFHNFGSASGIWWVETRDAANILQCPGQPPKNTELSCSTL